MLRFTISVPMLCLLVACAAEPPEEPALPLPPPAPPRVQRAAPAPRVQPVPNGDSLAATATVTPVGPSSASSPPPAPAWRVARDGVVGCADRSTLAVLNQGAEGTPRLLAEARASGGCRTTFRINEWVVEAMEADVVRLRMTNGGPLTLWFRRSEVVAP